jgi:hypothetical protein
MLRLPLIAVAALSVAAATFTSAQGDAPTAAAGTFASMTDIEWSYATRARDDRGEPYLRFEREGMSTTMSVDGLPEAQAALASATPGQPVSFAVAREAGALACTGRVAAPGRAGGTCRFDPDHSFVAALAAHGLVPEDGEDLLGLAFVDARLGSIEDLSRAGFAVTTVDELMTVSALQVTGAYALALRDAGLQPEDLDALVSARAVGVEPGWVSEMAQAGYPGLDLNKAIELRALGVTTEYARRMARVARAMEGTE